MTPPTVTPGTDASACTVPLVDFTDPVPVHLPRLDAPGLDDFNACWHSPGRVL